MKIDSLNSPTDGNSVFGTINHIINLSLSGPDKLEQSVKFGVSEVNQNSAQPFMASVSVTKVTQQALNYYNTVKGKCQSCK